MAHQLFSNNANTTLATSLTAIATTLTLATGTARLFPNPAAGQFFALSLTDAATRLLFEVVYCTAVVSDTLTVARGQEGTTAVPWNVGDVAYCPITAGSAAAFIQADQLQLQTGNFAVDSGTANALVLTLSPAPFTLATLVGAPVRVQKSATPNSGAVTLAINGFAAKAILHGDGTPLTAGELGAGAVFTVIYNGTAFYTQGMPKLSALDTLGRSTLLGLYPTNTTGSITRPLGATTLVLSQPVSSPSFKLWRGGILQDPLNGYTVNPAGSSTIAIPAVTKGAGEAFVWIHDGFDLIQINAAHATLGV